VVAARDEEIEEVRMLIVNASFGKKNTVID